MRISTAGLLALGIVSGVRGQDEPHFVTDWTMNNSIPLGRNVSYTYVTKDTNQQPPPSSDSPSLMLCQTSAIPPEVVSSNNTWTVSQIKGGCDIEGTNSCFWPSTNSQTTFFPLWPADRWNFQNKNNFFLCFGLSPAKQVDDFTCRTYSEFFNIEPENDTNATGSSPIPVKDDGASAISAQTSAVASLVTAQIPKLTTPTTALHITTNTVVVNISSMASSPPTPIISTPILSLPVSTITSPPTDSASPIPDSSAKGGLSLGAKIGIGLGALSFVLIILLLALFCLQRRHTKRSISRSEQVMLTQSVHNESRDLVTEKEIQTGSTILDNDTDSGPPVLPRPTTRHSALSPYETLPSQPYKGSAAAIPRRKTGSAPTSAGSDTLTRAISTNSERTIEIPAAARTSNEHHFEEYHDVPMYSTPRAFHGSFLESEDGHSAADTVSEEEARRLEEARLEEEEERRIDAAIAEAERTRGPLR